MEANVTLIQLQKKKKIDKPNFDKIITCNFDYYIFFKRKVFKISFNLK